MTGLNTKEHAQSASIAGVRMLSETLRRAISSRHSVQQ